MHPSQAALGWRAQRPFQRSVRERFRITRGCVSGGRAPQWDWGLGCAAVTAQRVMAVRAPELRPQRRAAAADTSASIAPRIAVHAPWRLGH